MLNITKREHKERREQGKRQPKESDKERERYRKRFLYLFLPEKKFLPDGRENRGTGVADSGDRFPSPVMLNVQHFETGCRFVP